MRPNRPLALVAALLLWAAPALADDDGPDTESIEKAVVNVWTYEETADGKPQYGFGSGFVIAQEGYIVTNYHVVDGAKYVSVLLPGESEPSDGTELRNLFLRGRVARVLYTSPARDLAVIKVESRFAVSLLLADAPILKNSKVYAIGYPAAADDLFRAPTADPTLTTGVVGRTYSAPLHYSTTNESIPVIQHGAYINHGNSGGPLIDSCGRVVGVNSWGSFDKISQDASGGAHIESNSGVYYASNATNLIAFLRSNNVPMDVASNTCAPARMRGVLENGLIAALLAALLALALVMAFRKPRLAVVQAVNRSAEAVSQRISRRNIEDLKGPARRAPERPEATARVAPGAFRSLRFRGRVEALRLSFEITRNMLQRTHDGVVLGRLENGVDIRIDHGEVSRRHARIFLSGSQVMIEDLGALNGTVVNGRRLAPNAPAALADGSTVAFGPVVFDVEMG